MERLASLGPHKDVNDFEIWAGAKQLLHQHFAQEAGGPSDENGLAAIKSCNHRHDSSFSLSQLWQEAPTEEEKLAEFVVS